MKALCFFFNDVVESSYYISQWNLKEIQIGNCDFAVWIRYLLYWGMPLDLVIEGSVGGILSYMTREVPGETGSLGQNKLKRKVLSQ